MKTIHKKQQKRNIYQPNSIDTNIKKAYNLIKLE